jgi:hypothetical protein
MTRCDVVATSAEEEVAQRRRNGGDDTCWADGMKIDFWTEQGIWTNLEFEYTSNGKLEEPW